MCYIQRAHRSPHAHHHHPPGRRAENAHQRRRRAGGRGSTPSLFILDALERTVHQVEQDNAFHALAEERWAHIRATGQTVAWDDARAYLAARADGKRPRKPTARTPAA